MLPFFTVFLHFPGFVGCFLYPFGHLFFPFKIPAENIIVLHDDLDLALGKVRIKIGGGIAGHNGLRSINSMVSNKYVRVRIGIDHPQNKDLVSKYVLEDFSKDEFGAVNSTLDRISKLFPEILKGDHDLFGSEVNQINKD